MVFSSTLMAGFSSSRAFRVPSKVTHIPTSVVCVLHRFTGWLLSVILLPLTHRILESMENGKNGVNVTVAHKGHYALSHNIFRIIKYAFQIMHNRKISSKHTFCTQMEIKMTYLVFVFCYLLFLHPRPIWKTFYHRLRFWVVLNGDKTSSKWL